ncbi:hypothetical protein [Streptomyces hirsutus]|uniref:hypothetical protein n=1 Tax=Streptomyces hirsutus TaxID=35620 RepID=UPI0036886715
MSQQVWLKGEQVPRRDPAGAAATTAGLSTSAGYLAATYEVRRRPDRLHLVIGADRLDERLTLLTLLTLLTRDPEGRSGHRQSERLAGP